MTVDVALETIRNRCQHCKETDEALATLRQLNGVLDKIRADIEDWQTDIHDNEYDAKDHDFVFERIFDIIDKYRKVEE